MTGLGVITTLIGWPLCAVWWALATIRTAAVRGTRWYLRVTPGEQVLRPIVPALWIAWLGINSVRSVVELAAEQSLSNKIWLVAMVLNLIGTVSYRGLLRRCAALDDGDDGPWKRLGRRIRNLIARPAAAAAGAR